MRITMTSLRAVDKNEVEEKSTNSMRPFRMPPVLPPTPTLALKPVRPEGYHGEITREGHCLRHVRDGG